MVFGDFLDKVSATSQHFKANQEPFGGLRIICVADFEQLPPVGEVVDCFNSVSGREEHVRREPQFLFQSQVWICLGFVCFWLEHSWRYGNDIGMVELSSSLRGNVKQLSPHAQELMSNLWVKDSPADPSQEVTLCARTDDARQINAKRLEYLSMVLCLGKHQLSLMVMLRAHTGPMANDVPRIQMSLVSKEACMIPCRPHICYPSRKALTSSASKICLTILML